jgi:hypothetical protein
MNEVYTDCPSCGQEIPFYHTVDDLGECPECETPKDELFDIAQQPLADSLQVAAADGGAEE